MNTSSRNLDNNNSFLVSWIKEPNKLVDENKSYVVYKSKENNSLVTLIINEEIALNGSSK